MIRTSSLAHRSYYWGRRVASSVMGHCLEKDRDIVVVTGGGAGLGRELVLRLRKLGVRVAVLDIRPVASSQKVPGARYYVCDVGNIDDLVECHRLIKRDLGTPTALINNAAVAPGTSIVDMSFSEIQDTIRVNLLSCFYTTKLFLPDMLAKKRGYLVTIGSVLGHMSPANYSAYGASKSGLLALHESLTHELGTPSKARYGVKTLLVCPGQLRTDMFKDAKTPSRLYAPKTDPSFVARVVVGAMKMGRRGEVKVPFYGAFLPVFRSLPWPFSGAPWGPAGWDSSTIERTVALGQTYSEAGRTMSDLGRISRFGRGVGFAGGAVSTTSVVDDAGGSEADAGGLSDVTRELC